MVEGSGVLQP